MELTLLRRFALSSLLARALADFTSVDFRSAVVGGDLLLRWEATDAATQDLSPVYIQGTAISHAADNEVNVMKMNLTVTSSNSFNWTNIPYPLRYDATAEYELVVRPQNWDVESQGPPPTIAKSGLFTIAAHSNDGPPSTAIPQPSLAPAPSSPSDGRPVSNTTLIAALVVGIGIPFLIGVFVAVWCVRRRRREALEAKIRQRRLEMIIH